MPRLAKFSLMGAPVPAAFALGFLLSRYLVDRDLRDAESALSRSVANYNAARAEHVARLQRNYDQIQDLIDRMEQKKRTNYVKH